MEINIQNFDRSLIAPIAAKLIEFYECQSVEGFLDWQQNPPQQTREMLESLPRLATPGDYEEEFMMETYRQTGLHFLPEVVRAIMIFALVKQNEK